MEALVESYGEVSFEEWVKLCDLSDNDSFYGRYGKHHYVGEPGWLNIVREGIDDIRMDYYEPQLC